MSASHSLGEAGGSGPQPPPPPPGGRAGLLGGVRAIANDAVARLKAKVGSSGLRAPSRPLTVVAALVALIACTRPQILHVVLDLPWPHTIGDNLGRFVLLSLFVLGLTLCSAVGVVLVIAPEQVKVEQVGSPHWLSRIGQRLGYNLGRRWWPLDAIANVYNHLEAVAARAKTGGLRRRRTVGAIFVTVAALLLFLPLVVGSRGATNALAVNALPATPLLASGLWFLTARRGEPSPLRKTLGRYTAMLTLGVLFGELIWHLPRFTHGELSWRLYSIWGLPYVLWIVLATGRVVDRLSRGWRTGALAALIFLPQCDAGFLVRTGAISEDQAQQQMRTADEQEWFDRFENRIAGGSAADPIVFVAASGGGSRAAIFTALVLEHLGHTNLQGKAVVGNETTIADNIALVSSVSGGSLAAAYYLSRQGLQPSSGMRPAPLQYMRNEVAGSMRRLALQYQRQAALLTGDALESTDLRERRVEAFATIADELGSDGRDPSSAPWLFHSAFVDEMATDFMAPLLRGVFTPFVERGQSVSNFWSQQFSWEDIRQRHCWGAAASSANPWLCSWKPTRPPALIFFNATDVGTGRRVVMDFPPLPAGFLGPNISSSSDLGGPYNLALADAVRLSANFPWGFEIGVFRRLLPTQKMIVKTTDSDRPVVKLTDGGVIDNTGIDVLAAWLERIEALSRPGTVGPLADRALRIRKSLLRRGVLLVEVDSGARPDPSKLLGTLFPALSDPLDALSFAGYGTSVTMKAGQISRMRETMLRLASQEIDDQSSRVLDRTALFRHVPFVCNSADGVMTAWALGPQDKAKIFTLFLGDAKAKNESLRVSADAQQLLASAQLDVEVARARGGAASKLATKMAEDARLTEEERQHEEAEAARAEQPLNADEEPVSVEGPATPLGAAPPPTAAPAAKPVAGRVVVEPLAPRPAGAAPAASHYSNFGAEKRSAQIAQASRAVVPRGLTNDTSLKIASEKRFESAQTTPAAPAGAAGIGDIEQKLANAVVAQARKPAWVYLGQYDRPAQRWVTKYFDVPDGTTPEQLKGAKLKTLGRVRVRSAMPDAEADFGQVRAVLRRGDSIAVVDEPRAWESTGFIWARVE